MLPNFTLQLKEILFSHFAFSTKKHYYIIVYFIYLINVVFVVSFHTPHFFVEKFGERKSYLLFSLADGPCPQWDNPTVQVFSVLTYKILFDSTKDRSKVTIEFPLNNTIS